MNKLLMVLFIMTAAITTNAEKIRVACIGDSITYGSGIKNRATESYPARLQQMLGEKYDVKNFGNPGRGIIKSSIRGRGKRAFHFMKEHTAALEFKPHIVICNLGINDLMDFPKKKSSGEGFRGDDFTPDYKELIESYQKLPTNPKVWLWTPLAPLFPGQKFYQSPNIAKINNSIKDVVSQLNRESAQKNKKLSSKKRLPKVRSIDMETPLAKLGEHFPDKIHPDATAAKVIAETVYKNIFKSKKKK